MKTQLKLWPESNPYHDIIARFRASKPLSPEQKHTLHRHARSLSLKDFDPILDYYRICKKKTKTKRGKSRHAKTVYLPNQEFHKHGIAAFKEEVDYVLEHTQKNVEIKLTPQQFKYFKRHVPANELVFWHGDNNVIEAPYLPGGMQHIVFLQWGNLFGIAKLLTVTYRGEDLHPVQLHFEKMGTFSLEKRVEVYLAKQVPDETPAATPTPNPPQIAPRVSAESAFITKNIDQ